jgi:hypothetical protein
MMLRRLSAAIVAAAIRDQQRLVVDDMHEPGGIAARRGIESLGPAGRQYQERRGLDHRPVMRVDVVDFLGDRTPARYFAIQRVQRLDHLRHGSDVGRPRSRPCCFPFKMTPAIMPESQMFRWRQDRDFDFLAPAPSSCTSPDRLDCLSDVIVTAAATRSRTAPRQP